jgi:predicted Zn-dependent peptidase
MKRIFINIALSLTVLTVSAQVDRSKMPEAGPAPEIELGEIQSFTLDNGLKVFVVENHKLPRVTYSLELDIDPFTEGDKMGMSDIAGDLMSKGTSNRTKEELNFEIDYIGANFGTSGASMFGRSLTKHQETLLDIMSDVVKNTEMTEDELEKLKKQYISGLQTEMDDPDAISSKVRRVLLYGKDHPYGEIMTEETVENVTLEDVKGYYNTYWAPNVAYMAVVGDINLKQAKKLVKKYFGDWERKEVPSHEYETPAQPNQMQIAFVNKPGAVQSVITVCNTIDLKPGSEDAIDAVVTNGILGGGFVSKLNLNLREEHSYTYGARSSINSDELVGNFLATAKVRNEVTDSAIIETMKELGNMLSGKVTEDELKTIKNYRTGIFASSLENPGTKANFAINIEKYDMPEDYYATYLKRLSEVSLEDVNATAKKYINPNKGYILVVGNQEEVADKVKALSPSGMISFYDTYGNPVEETTLKPAPEGVTAESVIDAYIKAIGGEKKVKGLKSYKQTFTMSMQGMQLEGKAMVKSPNMLLNEITMGGNVVQKQVLNGDKGGMSGMQGSRALTEEEVVSMQEEAIIIPELFYNDDDHELELKGMDMMADQQVYVVAITTPSGSEMTNYYAVESGLLVGTISVNETPQGSFSEETTYMDYKEIEGVKFPQTMKIAAGPQRIEMKITETLVNPNIDDSEFSVE